MDKQRSFDEYRMPDAMWKRFQKLLPEYPTSPRGGRPRANLRDVADAIFYRLRTGCQWNAIPPALAAGSTAHDYFQEWTERGLFEEMWQLALEEYDHMVGLDWQWQSVDGAMTKAPLGGDKTGKNPTDRGKLGTKRSLATDAVGIPTGLAVAGANVHDVRLLEETLEHRHQIAPMTNDNVQVHLCLDKAYDSKEVRALAETVYHYTHHIRSRGEEQRELDRKSGEQPRRWVVERTHGWLNRFRAVLIRWAKKAENHLAELHLACAHATMSQAGVLG